MKTVKAGTETQSEHVELLHLLAATIRDTGEEALADELKKLAEVVQASRQIAEDTGTDHRDANRIRKRLSEIEERPRLRFSVWTLIVQYKGWLDKKRTREDFVKLCRQTSGLI